MEAALCYQHQQVLILQLEVEEPLRVQCYRPTQCEVTGRDMRGAPTNGGVLHYSTTGLGGREAGLQLPEVWYQM